MENIPPRPGWREDRSRPWWRGDDAATVDEMDASDQDSQMPDAPSQSDPAVLEMLESSVNTTDISVGVHDNDEPDGMKQLFERHWHETAGAREFSAQPTCNAPEIHATEYVEILPTVLPSPLPAPPSCETDSIPDSQLDGNTRDQEFYNMEKKLVYEQDCRRALENQLDDEQTLRREAQEKLDNEQTLRTQAESELLTIQSARDDYRQRWKKAAHELGKVQRQAQISGLYQITDDYLVRLVDQLRYNIRCFSIQYFGERIGQFLAPSKSAEFYRHMVATVPNPTYLLEYLGHTHFRPKLVQAFLWQVLVHRVFNRFIWGGPDSHLLRDLSMSLEPRYRSDANRGSDASPESVRKFQTWRATTVGLFLESNDLMDLESNREMQVFIQDQKTKILQRVEEVIAGLRRPDNQGYAQQFHAIIDEALRLDKEISRQASAVRWHFPEQGTVAVFDPSTMEAKHMGEMDLGARPMVVLVMSPGVVKRGKSTGDEFDNEVMLRRMEVECIKPPAR